MFSDTVAICSGHEQSQKVQRQRRVAIVAEHVALPDRTGFFRPSTGRKPRRPFFGAVEVITEFFPARPG